jgi:AsmA protein
MKPFKWLVIVIAGLVIIVIGSLIIVPMFIDVQRFKPEIEKRVAAATGRPFAIEGNLHLSLFPWAGFSFTDLRLGNPPGFTEKEMLSIDSFDVQVRLIPLLSRDLRVKRFVIEGPRVALERRKDGKGNWEGLLEPRAASAAQEKAESRNPGGAEPSSDLPVRSIAAGETTVRNGTLLWIDAAKGERKEIRDLELELKDLSLDRPIHLTLSAKLDENPVKVNGRLGPWGRESRGRSVPLQLAVSAFREITVSIRGVLSGPEKPNFDLALDVAPFSPRKLMNAMGRTPPETSDPGVLEKAHLKARVKGDGSRLALSDGILELDQTRIRFSAEAKEFSRPDVSLKLEVDQIDLDRYLPRAEVKREAGGEASSQVPDGKKPDYGPLRKAVVEAEIRGGEVKVLGAQTQDLLMKLKGKDGLFHVDTLAFRAYQGSMVAKADLDLRTDRPKTSVDLEAAGIRIRPLLNDLMKKEFLEGRAEARLSLKMEGDESAAIRRSLNGSGDLRLTDGAVIGIDLPGMVRNVKAAFGGEAPAERPKTDFSELLVPFTVKDGVVHTSGTRMASPLLRVVATGKADLVKESLDMRVEPAVVGTLKGQQDTKERSGIMIPVLVNGTFDAPSFSPDLKGMLETGIQEKLKSPGSIEDLPDREGAPASPKDRAREVLKGIFGR